MPGSAYTTGYDQWAHFLTEDFGALLVDDTYVFDPDHEIVADVVAGEFTLTGYSRVALSGKTRTPDLTLNRLVYDCDDLNFGPIDLGGQAEAYIIYRLVTNDADSLLVGYYPLGGVETTGIDFEVVLNTAGLALYRSPT